jgi:endoglucanase
MMKNIYTGLVFLCLFILPVASRSQTTKFISVRGKEIIGPDKKPFLMKGTNLGNWLVPEGYMFKFKSVNSAR